MTPRTRPQEEPGLFDDLPLHSDSGREPSERQPGTARSAPDQPRTPEVAAESLPLFTDAPGLPSSPPKTEAEASDVSTRPAWRPVVPVVAQISAGLTDLVVILVVGLLGWLGVRWMGVRIDLTAVGLLAVFLLPFSYLYEVFPLAFWGRTPGMARLGLVARSRDGRSLTFSQASLRWLASLVTVCLAGFPWILTAVTGRSLADRFSGSQTLPAR